MADAARRRVRAIGSYGIPFEQLSGIRPTLVNTPIAQRALLEDKVVVVSERIEEEVPPEYAQLLGITTLVCTPLSAGGYAYGVICADRGGGRFELSDGERHLLWTLGKTAALVAAARNVDPPAGAHSRARRAARPRPRDPRERAPAPVRRVARAGRRAAARPCRARTLPDRDAGGAERPAPGAGAAARAAAARDRHDARGRARPRPAIAGVRRRGRLARRVDGARPTSSRSRSRCSPRRCATSPSTPTPHAWRSRSRAIRTRSRSRCATTAPARGRGDPGMGLRLAAFEALQQGGVVEFGPVGRRSGGGCGWPSRSSRISATRTRSSPRSSDGRSPAARAGRRRPRRRPLGVPRAARRAAVGRAVLPGADRRRGDRARARPTSRMSRSSTCFWPTSRAPSCARRSARPRRRRACC